MATITATRRAATASALDTVRVGLQVLLPLIAQGAVIRLVVDRARGDVRITRRLDGLAGR